MFEKKSKTTFNYRIISWNPNQARSTPQVFIYDYLLIIKLLLFLGFSCVLIRIKFNII